MNCNHLEEIDKIVSKYKPGQAFLTGNGDSQRYWELKRKHIRCSLKYMLDYSEMVYPEDKTMTIYLKSKIKELDSLSSKGDK